MAKKEIDDRFKKFGTVSFTSISKVNDFVGYLEDGKVMATKCKDCGHVFFPPRADCCDCLTSNMDWQAVSGKGKLVSFSKLEYGPVGFEGDLPYTIALLDFGGYKVFGRLSNELSDKDVAVGTEMTVEANKLPNGQINYIFKKA
ncbi:MAG: Zn-ribbon domain-containing OB-fold protein [Deltaproteobacteria bacterium]|nr:Zn-ribbon domain-containing OB-fold protein [Deltaproteobacteria bacterium]